MKSKQTLKPPDGAFDYEGFEKEAIGRLNGRASLVGPDGVLTGLIQWLVNVALSGEADSHIREGNASDQPNRRNGHTSKVLDTELGPVPISLPRDRAGSYEPQRQRRRGIVRRRAKGLPIPSSTRMRGAIQPG